MKHTGTGRGMLVAALLSAAMFFSTGAVAVHDDERQHSHLGGIEPGMGMIWYRDIVYDPSFEDAHRTSLDVYVPEPLQSDAAPVVVFVHGGGFRGSDKAYYKDLGHKPGWLTHDRGYLFVSVNFRFVPEGGYPESFQDVANALAWVHDNIAEFGGDPERIVLLAHATGGHKGALVATDETFLENAGKGLDLLSGLIIVDSGFFELAGMADNAVIRRAVPLDPETLAQASPIRHVRPGKAHPPTLILYGDEGGRVQMQSEAMASALRGAGVSAQAYELLGKDHFTSNEHIGIPGDPATIIVERFLDAVLTAP